MTAPESSSSDAINKAMGSMGQAERLVALGALVIVAIDLIGGLIADEYFVSTLPWFLSVLIVLAVFAHRMRGSTMPIDYGWWVSRLALLAGGVVAYFFLYDLRNGFFDGADIFYAIVEYVAAGLLLFGGYTLAKQGA
ncbi:MAG TPA: hypothetical protein VGC47_06005 [Acidimicrobiia bacterium]